MDKDSIKKIKRQQWQHERNERMKEWNCEVCKIKCKESHFSTKLHYTRFKNYLKDMMEAQLVKQGRVGIKKERLRKEHNNIRYRYCCKPDCLNMVRTRGGAYCLFCWAEKAKASMSLQRAEVEEQIQDKLKELSFIVKSNLDKDIEYTTESVLIMI